MTTKLRTVLALAASIAVIPVVAAPADAASKTKSKAAATKTAKKRTAAKPTRKATKKTTKAKAVNAVPVATTAVEPAPPEVPASIPAPTFTSVISIGGFVFYNVSYADAVAQYEALIASGVTPPPPVTSISVTTTVGN